VAEPAYADGTPLPRCQYCGEFFTGYPGNQICAECHDHIGEMEKTIAQLRADIVVLVEFAEAQFAVNSGIIGFDLHNDAVDRLRSAESVIQPIIEKYREGVS